MRRVFAALMASSAAEAGPGDPLGNEFRVNGTTSGYQRTADVARDADGDSVVVWQGAGGRDIFARRYGPDGQARGAQFKVNTVTGAWNEAPAVAMNAAGRFVVVWKASATSTGPGDIQGRVFSPNGTALTAQLVFNSFTTGDQEEPDVAFDPNGDFVAVWMSDGTGAAHIIGRRIAADAGAASDEFQVDPTGAIANGGYGLANPSVSVNTAGDFNVVWQGLRFNEELFVSTSVIWSRDFFNNGSSAGAFVVEEVPQSTPLRTPVVALDDSNELLIAYRATRDFDPITNQEVYGVLYGPQDVHYFRIDDGTFSGGGTLDLAAPRAGGRFTAVWDALDVDGYKRGVRERRFLYDGQGANPTATPQGGGFLVNTTALSDQFDPALAMAPDGGTLTVWTSLLQDGDNDGIYGQFHEGGSGPDTSPDPFHFKDKGNLDFGVKVKSNTITIAGIDAAAPISISGSASARYSINGGAFTKAEGAVVAGDQVRLRLTTGSTTGAVSKATLNVGGVTDEWSVSTIDFGR